MRPDSARPGFALVLALLVILLLTGGIFAGMSRLEVDARIDLQPAHPGEDPAREQQDGQERQDEGEAGAGGVRSHASPRADWRRTRP